jgi:hypothetical protein
MRRIRFVAAVLAAAIAVFALAASTAAADDEGGDGGGTTTVFVNPAVVPVLTALEVAPLRPGKLFVDGGLVQATFPISGIDDGVVGHAGGLRFTPVGGGELKIRQFNVDLNTGFLTANTWLNGKRLKGRVPIFALGAPQPIAGQPACGGVPAGLTLTSAAAGALGAPQYTGAFIGNACVVPD